MQLKHKDVRLRHKEANKTKMTRVWNRERSI